MAAYLNDNVWTLLDEMGEVESGKATVDQPQLAHAMALCRLPGATLCVAKLKQLSRGAHFFIGPDKSDVDFVAVDMPNATKLAVGLMALVAQQEREAISAPGFRQGPEHEARRLLRFPTARRRQGQRRPHRQS